MYYYTIYYNNYYVNYYNTILAAIHYIRLYVHCSIAITYDSCLNVLHWSSLWAWWGYTKLEGRNRIEQLIRRLKRRGFLHPQAKSASELALETDSRLLRAISFNQHHVLYPLFPPIRPIRSDRYSLRPRPHGFSLPNKDDCNFVSRVLFKNMYWLSSLNYNTNGPLCITCL